jgi:transposase-like protein
VSRDQLQFYLDEFVVCAQAKPTMRGRAGFEIVPRMENENGRTRRVRRRFSAEEKARIVGLYEQSGLARVEFCRRQGVSLFNLQRWLGKRRQSGEARFVELEARAIEEQGRYRLGFGEGAWLEVEAGFDEREVRVLASIVREAALC